jgi:omega-6 fatty acid desaturase (delta-12 desaturase)
VHWTNLAFAGSTLALSYFVGWAEVLVVQLPILALASIFGVWLFTVQHRFETTLWTRHAQWSARTAALRGSSYLRLPRVLQWFTASIGFHHVHHLNPRIPNYRLASCHAAVPALSDVPALTVGASLRSLRLALWDEEKQRMVSFRPAHRDLAETIGRARSARVDELPGGIELQAPPLAVLHSRGAVSADSPLDVGNL